MIGLKDYIEEYYMSKNDKKIVDGYEDKSLFIDIDTAKEVFITSDTHFNQKRTFELSRRNKVFNSVTHMDKVMLENLERKFMISKDFVFIHLGDRGNDQDSKDATDICSKMKRLNKLASDNNGRSYLILGNYERDEMRNLNMTFEKYKEHLILNELWTDVFEEVAFIESTLEVMTKAGDKFNPQIMLVHEPIKYSSINKHLPELEDGSKRFCFFGHIHGRQMVKKFGLEVGVDAHNYAPLTLEDCTFFINSLTMGYYDENVWC